MRLSTAGRYALRAMVDLAQHEGQGPALRKEIAERQQISSDYLAQLFVKLKKAGLVESVLGPGGGYVLARGASQISTGDVLRAVSEPLNPVYCVDVGQESACQRVDSCPTHPLWVRLAEVVNRVLDATTLAELSQQPRQVSRNASNVSSVIHLEKKE